jgi:hypothetical protein
MGDFSTLPQASGRTFPFLDLYDYLVGGGEHRRRNIRAESHCGLAVDHKLELDWLLHRQYGLSPQIVTR